MSANPRPLNFVDHGKVKISRKRLFPHVKEQQIVPIVVHEFSRVSSEMPVVFVKNAETGEFQPVAILGLETGENVFYSESGWQSSYIPASVSHHPFALMPTKEDETQLQVIILETDRVMSETEGDLLFNEDGTETEYLQKRKNTIGKYYENMHVTRMFVQQLVENNLLTEQSLTIDLNDEKRQINGLYLVDEKKLNSLPDADFLTLRKKGYLPAIYAHMLSLQQLSRLAALKTQ